MLIQFCWVLDKICFDRAQSFNRIFKQKLIWFLFRHFILVRGLRFSSSFFGRKMCDPSFHGWAFMHWARENLISSAH